LTRLKFIDNISGLQAVQLLRFVTFLIISIVFTKSHLSRAQIGNWELFLFISSLLSFFWVTGIIQSLLTLYSRNRTFREDGEAEGRKSPEIFNAFLLITFFSVLVFAMGIPVKVILSASATEPEIPYANMLLLYILVSNPVTLIEYIYLLNKRPHRILQYGIYTYGAQMLLVMAPVLAGFDEKSAIWGLFVITGVRWVWLIILLRRYTLLKVSYDFIREHLKVGLPLILTFLISGSAQYIDGIIVSARYADPGVFAMYRYGAKEFPLVLLLANGLSNAQIRQTDQIPLSDFNRHHARGTMGIPPALHTGVYPQRRRLPDLPSAYHSSAGLPSDHRHRTTKDKCNPHRRGNRDRGECPAEPDADQALRGGRGRPGYFRRLFP